VTKETLTAEAEVHRTMALLAGDIATANSALVTKAKLHGLIQERHAHGGDKPGEPVKVIHELRWLEPEPYPPGKENVGIVAK
jgi:hypothetical protein